MHVHNVYFWLKDSLDADALSSFEQGLASLAAGSAVESGYFGKPAATDRDVVDNSYSYGLVLAFSDLAAHDSYQASPTHLKFVDDNLDKWERVIVYDIET